MRYYSFQYIIYLKNDLYLTLAKQANNMAKYFENQLILYQNILKITKKVETNQIFLSIPNNNYFNKIINKYRLRIENKLINEIRIICSYCTEKKEIDEFIDFINFISSKL
jgi:threonine aldolase